MKDRKTMKSGMIWILLSVLLSIAMVFGQSLIWAADSDGDGFTDAEELDMGIDPNKKDLFVIWVPANPSYLPSGQNPLEYVESLPINIHRITANEANTDRTLRNSSSNQKAVRITEDLGYYGADAALGFSWEGTPNGYDDATVYTEQIRRKIESAGGCSGSIDSNWCTNCCDTTGTCGAAFFYKYIKHTIAHEIGHMIRPLAPVSQRDKENFGGYHYKTGTNVILDMSVKCTYTKGKAIFYLGTTYTQADKSNITLK